MKKQRVYRDGEERGRIKRERRDGEVTRGRRKGREGKDRRE
jgi:hypothetical protein